MKLLCVGLMVCDVLVKPVTQDTLIRDSSNVDFVKMSAGGDAFNVAVNTAKLGVSSSVAGIVGDDQFGDYMLTTAALHGINCGGVKIEKGAGTAVSVVLISPSGERSFAYYSGACDVFSVNDVADAMLEAADYMFVGSAFGMPALSGMGLEKLLKRAKDRRVTVFMDVTGSPTADMMEDIKDSLPFVDHFLPSYGEASALTGEKSHAAIAQRLAGYGCKNIVIKCGDSGCYMHSGARSGHVPAYPAVQVDSTGAGDAFVSGYIWGASQGFDLERRVKSGAAAGSLCVRHIGAVDFALDENMLRTMTG